MSKVFVPDALSFTLKVIETLPDSPAFKVNVPGSTVAESAHAPYPDEDIKNVAELVPLFVIIALTTKSFPASPPDSSVAETDAVPKIVAEVPQFP